MNRRLSAAVAVTALLAAAPAPGAAANALTDEERAAGWILLFDGKSLDGWETSSRGGSRKPVEDGAINPHGAGGYMLVHRGLWSDFILSLEFRISKGCNSGIFLRTSTLETLPGKDVGYNGIEIAIDDTPGAGHTDTGAIYDLAKPRRNAMRPAGDWNRIRIACEGSRIGVELNGEAVTEADLDAFAEPGKRPDGSDHKFGVALRDHPRIGRIGLQDHGSDCWFRDIKLLPLGRAPRRSAELSRAWGERTFAEVPGPAGGRLPIAVVGSVGSPGSPPASAFPPAALAMLHEDFPGDTKVNRCAFGGPMRLGGKVAARGIGVNSRSVLRATLDRPAERLLGRIGLDSNVDGTVASVRFHVRADGKEVFATGVVRPADGPRPIDVPLGGAREVDLEVDDGGDGRSYDQADWAEARIVLAGGSEVWLDDLIRCAAAGLDLPFSFVYGGRPSEELLVAWPRTLRVETSPGREVRSLSWKDPATALEVEARATVFTRSAGVDWVLRFSNRGGKESQVLESVRAIDLAVDPGLGAAPVLHRLRGSACAADDWLPFDEPLPPGARIEIAPAGGRSSSGASPFLDVSWEGGGIIAAVGWSGQWKAAVERERAGAVRLRAGQETLRTVLRPGESIRGPRILALLWAGTDPWTGCDEFRRTMLREVLPRIDGRPVAPPITHLTTAFYEMNASTEENVLSHLSSIRGLGFEVLWLDAYWTRGGFPEGMGHYGFPLERAEPPDRFPRGVRPVGDAARREGMGFLMWFEPERVAPGTAIAKEHPEWMTAPGNGGLLDLGNPEARAYMTRYLIEAIRRYGVDWLRIDFNMDPLPSWKARDAKEPSRAGVAEALYIEGLYRMWDDILAACPGLAIDNCASGGRRIDIETCSRSVPLWRTDATIDPLIRGDLDAAALQNQVMTAGLGRYIPYSTSGQMGADPYRFRSGFNGGISFCEDCRPAAYPRDLLRAGVAEGKRIRKYFAGDLTTLTDITMSPRDWCVLQYGRPEEEDGMVLAFRRHRSPYASCAIEPRGIDPGAAYEVIESRGYAPGAPRTVSGRDLLRWKIEIDERPGSVVLEYRRVRAGN